MDCIGRGVLLPPGGACSCGALLAELQRVCPLLAASPGVCAAPRALACCHQPPCLEIAPAPATPRSAVRVPGSACTAPPPAAGPPEAAPAESVQVTLSAQRESFVMQTMRQAHYGGGEAPARAESARLPAPQASDPREARRSHASRPRTAGPRLPACPEEPPGRVQFRGAPEAPPLRCEPAPPSEFSDFGCELLAAGQPEDRRVCGAPWVDAQDLLSDGSEHSEFYRLVERELARLPEPAAPALPESEPSLDALPVHASPRGPQIIEPTPAALQEPEEPAPPQPPTPGRSDSVSADITESLLVEGRPLPDRPPGPEPSEGSAGYSGEAFDSSGSPRGLTDEAAGSAGLDEEDLLGSVGGDLRALLMDSGSGSLSAGAWPE
ncbi:hypothetical protein GL50803_00d23876 [Giardia duodenalis]|uniref:Uncharacterized protein n=1 Tax=Giardia intestinalis (strain ATCC 50803 / WB clone C6) TaxID=184922 RepID=A0A644F6M1_GIAIC|nr:hypothetical protein GL50803_00d23876 [Giardia intestinalis]KAE8304032.1 hypothetical protein GL50803_00d23876 [Giardia intestinalis]